MSKEIKNVKIQIGSTDNDAERYDKDISSDKYRTIIMSRGDAVKNKMQDALEQLIEGLNNEDIFPEGNFFRIVINEEEVINL